MDILKERGFVFVKSRKDKEYTWYTFKHSEIACEISYRRATELAPICLVTIYQEYNEETQAFISKSVLILDEYFDKLDSIRHMLESDVETKDTFVMVDVGCFCCNDVFAISFFTVVFRQLTHLLVYWNHTFCLI